MQYFGVLIPGRRLRTDFQLISDTSLQLQVDYYNEITNLTIFGIQAPLPPEGKAYSVYIQQARDNPVFIGQITQKQQSLSLTISQYIKNKENLCTGFIQVHIEDEMPFQPDGLTVNAKLIEVGKLMVDDFYNFISSYEDVYFQGEHYVPYTAVQRWQESLNDRIKLNQKFWNKIQ